MSKEIGVEMLDLSPRTLQVLKTAKLNNVKNILLLSPLEIQKKTKLSHNEVLAVLSVASHAILASEFVSAFQLLCHNTTEHHRKRLSVGCPILDEFLSGGILTKSVTEISGESASGKTQLCLQLSLCVQLQPSEGGLSAATAYICTEDVFPIRRLYQLIHFTQEERPALGDICFGHNIYITQIGDLETLAICLKQMLPPLLRVRNVKLVIIDSLAAVFRCEYDAQQSRQRAKNLQALGFYLHKIAQQYDAAVICVNQVTDVINNEHLIIGPSKKVTPSLGLVWANAVTTRLMLSRIVSTHLDQDSEVPTSVDHNLRLIEVIYAPHLPNSQCSFTITNKGIRGVKLEQEERLSCGEM